MANRPEFTSQYNSEPKKFDFPFVQIIKEQDNTEAFKKSQQGTIVAVESDQQVTFFYGNKKAGQTASVERITFDQRTLERFELEQPVPTSELRDISQLEIKNAALILHLYPFKGKQIVFTEKQTSQGLDRYDIHFFPPQILIK